MALIKCEECGHMMSDAAQRCPKCGCPTSIHFMEIYYEGSSGKSSVSCPLKPSDSAPLKHSTMPP